MGRMPLLAGASLQGLRGHRVAAALSGGADSVALALWLRRHHDHGGHGLVFAGLIHVNHKLRGAESDRDETFCRALARRLDVPIEVVDAPIDSSPGRSPEGPARAARYRAFATAAATLGATRVVTAHTADDQAETVLMRLLRGAGNRGLSGIRAERGLYVRPFLGCRRHAVRSWLLAQGEEYCEDSTNADRSIARNRVRHDLLPVIEATAPGGIAALARVAALAADDEAVLQRLAAESAMSLVLRADPREADLDRTLLATMPPAIARRVLRQVCERLAPHAPWRAEHFDAVLRLAARPNGGGALCLPGVRIERVSNVMSVRAGVIDPVPAFAYTLAVGGDVVVPEAGLQISARVLNGAAEHAEGTYELVVPSAVFPVTVRNRRAGDRVRLSGGTRKIQDLMVDAKIPRSERSRVVLLVGVDGQILWVNGRLAAGVVTDRIDAGDMVTLKVRKLELT